MIKLIKGDCLEQMKSIESGSVDMVLTDPPYGTVKGATLDGWSKDKTYWDTTINTQSMFKECDRILRKNGACALFAQQPFTTELISNAIPNMPFSYNLTWLKDHFANSLLAKKAPVNYTEDICLFFKKHTKHDFGGTHPLRDYAEEVFNKCGGKIKQINLEMGHRRAEHFFYYGTSQFGLCTEKTYNELIELYNIDQLDSFIEYKELKEINEKFKKELNKRMQEEFPKVFNLPEGQKYKSNVLQYKKDYQGLHPTQKPVALLEDLIKTYTRPGDTVVDFTMGSGSTAIACLNTGRKFIGIELDDNYFEIAKKRIEDHKNNLTSNK